ncbi:cobyric acid synthase CobQ [Oceanidesulfovibrio marinus]|uniref:Cobyric acid synthase n=2 Tax=Oceanidesulfovibrio marinus TaxID=370038 RepID=A0A6P1ZC27_9BACT|nr:cobyric acid synthase [Oceanidesulfovibrio marinus]TVM30501.1 cobyric acid synthase CobQ [Oceanidesulfovibrio marinus]
MFQGTCSNAGKSVLAAAFCRMLRQDGFRVAPFKAQNMSLNSFVTADGLEMGRAQVTQAQAAGLEPDVRMNPVLLKPSSDVGSQVIVMGKPVGTMRVGEYVRYKPTAFQAAQRAYDSLAAESDVIVLEGAGSPAEINLKAHDIVNMAMAQYAGAAVVLVGDIDRGGVFASLVGTMELLEPEERELVAGYVLNKFRGDASLLTPAYEFMQQRTGRTVLGVVPHSDALGLPEEDSVSFKSGLAPACARFADRKCADIAIAVADLPHISNFTDGDALAGEPDVSIYRARTPDELADADVILLPGSKNTLADLDWLQATGMAGAVTAAAARGVEIVGICGGFQMLGATIADPHGLESDRLSARGLGLLPVHTTMGRDKTLVRQSAVHLDTEEPVTGYEIHHGATALENDSASTDHESSGPAHTAFRTEDGAVLGYASRGGRVWGTYLHGVFDADAFRRRWLDTLRTRKNLAPIRTIVAPYDIEPALDRLADLVRQHVDWRSLYHRIGLR